MPEAFLRLLHGKNFGKQIVRTCTTQLGIGVCCCARIAELERLDEQPTHCIVASRHVFGNIR
jgi:hypothetical protein